MAEKNINLDQFNMSDAELFSRVNHDELESEKITAPRYSYWQSVFRVFFRKKVNVIALTILAILLIFTYVYPAVTGYDAAVDPYINLMDSGAKHLNPQQAMERFGQNIHWILGSGASGQSTFDAIWYGSSISVSMALICAAINMTIGVIVGAIWGFSKFDLVGLAPYVDYFNIMNYDLYCGTLFSHTHHHTPPFDNQDPYGHIPTGGSVKIKSDPTPRGLIGFDAKREYAIKDREEREAAGEKLPKRMTPKGKQVEMGKITNLITDMTITGAPLDDIALAVRHSQVVIDAEKHDLDYRRSAKENQIDRLRREYQRQSDGSVGGASTLISRAKSEARVDTKKEVIPTKDVRYSKDYKGEKLFADKTSDTYIDYKTGEVKHRQMKSTKMAETNDARTLISDYNTPVEREYATYANRLKSLANEARKQYYTTENPKRDPAAAKQYAAEVESLNKKLKIAQQNAPRERQAQLYANKLVSMQKEAHPEYAEDADWLKKRKNEALRTARTTYGASKEQIQITPREWQAIQARAIGSTNLTKILNNSDMDTVKKLATPRQTKGLSNSQIALAKTMQDRGYSLTDISKRLGVSSSTISKAVRS